MFRIAGKLGLASLLLVAAGASAFTHRTDLPAGYKGKPYTDATHPSVQTIPGRVEAAFFDTGGEGVAYHDIDAINHGSGELNLKPEHCEPGVPKAICNFRQDEGMDISYVKKGADLNHANMVTPDFQQLYIGWTDDAEWVNYTVNVKQAGVYKIIAMYSHKPQTLDFSINGNPAAHCRLPVDPSTQIDLKGLPDWVVWHVWNKAECGEIKFPAAGTQLLTMHFNSGSNFAYFDFEPAGK
jgi:hypothetical protein